MDSIEGKAFVFVGRFGRAERGRAIDEIEARGGEVRRGLSRKASFLVVGRGAYRLIGSGTLQRKLQQAEALGIECMSEARLYERLGLAPPGTAPASISWDIVAERSGVSFADLRMLALFELIHLENQHCRFEDLPTAKQARSLFAQGASQAEVVEALIRLADRAGGQRPHRFELNRAPDGEVRLWLNGTPATFEGQMLLPLDDAGNPTLDEIFEDAEIAEAEGDLVAAASLYRRCMAIDKKDPAIPFNLANVLQAADRLEEAAFYLRVALAIDGAFPEAWYNLADIAERRDDLAESKRCLQSALSLDPGYADAVYNLARTEFKLDAHDQAIRLWERYLALDSDSEWAAKARQGLFLCRHYLASSRPD